VSEPTVLLEGVSKAFGRQMAVSEVDLAIEPGICVGLVGHNGAGKSTMIKMMLGLLRPTAGRVRVLGEDPASRSAAGVRLALGYLPENVALHPSMTGLETLAFYARLKRQPASRNPELLERVGLAQAAGRRVGTYSKGMRQRLGLAQALLGSPRAMLLDEPTSGLDPELRQSFYDIIAELRDEGASVLLSSHALAELEGRVDRVVVMNQGRKVADGTIHELRRLAGIRPRVRLRLDGGLRAVVNGPPLWQGWSQPVRGMLEAECDEDEIASLLQCLPPGSQDVEIIRPSLDDIYAEFLRHRAAPGERA
jgi:Cu-processing system ATP-binding protein